MTTQHTLPRAAAPPPPPSVGRVGRSERLLALAASLPGAFWWLFLFLVPSLILASYAFLTTGFLGVEPPWTLENVSTVIRDGNTYQYLWNSLVVGLPAALSCLVVAVPVAYWLRFHASRPTIALLLVVLTIFASYLVRVYSWRTVLGSSGLINDTLIRAGIIDQPLEFILFSRFSVTVAMVHMLLPLAILLMYDAFRAFDSAYLEAARDLGAGRTRTWSAFLLPSIARPAATTFLLILLIASADWATPQYLGDGRSTMIGQAIQQAFTVSGDIAGGAALCLVFLLSAGILYLLAMLVLRLAGLDRLAWRDTQPVTPTRSRWGGALYVAILVFLYVPLGLVVLFSFNDGTTLSLPMEGLSLRWYQEFFANAVAVDALRLSLTVAVVVTLLTSLIGGLSAIGLARLPRSRSASLLVAFFLLPIAAPPLFLGLALLSMWDQSGIQLGFGTIVAAHLLVTVPIFALLSLSALGRVDPALSEAAHDLGASRVQAFRRVVLPQVWPAFAAAAAVTFAVSMDEFVVTVFNTGEQSTLPMYINGILRKTINPSINSISTLTILVTFVALGVGAIAARRATRRAQAPSDTEVVL